MKILAGIVTYNPDINRLKENISAIHKQVDQVIIFDNSSTNFSELSFLCNEFNINIIRSSSNVGIAKALNKIFLFAKENQFDWVLTLDQDSVASDALVENYLQYSNNPDIGIITCNITDRNLPLTNYKSYKTEELLWCITSGSFCSIRAYIDSDGFDDWLFIDSVDLDYCLNLKKHKYTILKICYDGLLHEIGKSKIKTLFGKKIVIYNENISRQYYMARNYIYLSYKYPKQINRFKVYKEEIRSIILILLYEKDKIKKIKNRLTGFIDGIKAGKRI